MPSGRATKYSVHSVTVHLSKVDQVLVFGQRGEGWGLWRTQCISADGELVHWK